MQDQAVHSAGRRDFLRAGFLGSAVLATISSTALLTGCSQIPQKGLRLLRPADVQLLRALIPVVMGGALPQEREARSKMLDTLVGGLDAAVFSTSVSGRKQFLQLFDLLTFAPTRFLLAGMKSDWAESSAQEVDAFLQKWQYSSVGLFNAGYNGLVQAIKMQWYVQPESWAAIGYVKPGRTIDA